MVASMRGQGFLSASSRGRRTGRGVLVVLAALGLSIAVPATATSTTKPSAFPSCRTLSRTALANLAQTGPLALTRVVGPYCYFTGHISGHYEPELQVAILPYTKYLWLAATGRPCAAGAICGHFNSKLFDVTAKPLTSAGLSPCKANDLPLSRITGPACAGEPTANAFIAYTYGSYKSSGLQLMVTAGLTGQQGDVHLSHLIALVQQVLSGKIH